MLDNGWWDLIYVFVAKVVIHSIWQADYVKLGESDVDGYIIAREQLQ